MFPSHDRGHLNWPRSKPEMLIVDVCEEYAEWLIKDIRKEVHKDIDKEMEKYAK